MSVADNMAFALKLAGVPKQVRADKVRDAAKLLKDGVLQQVGTPRSLYDSPSNAFVAGFVVPLLRETMAAVSEAGLSQITLGLRPECFQPTLADG